MRSRLWGEDVFVVEAWDVIFKLDDAHAQKVAQAMVEQGVLAERKPADLGSDQWQHTLVDELRSGRIGLVRLEHAPRLLDAPKTQRLADLTEPDEPIQPLAQPGFVSFQLLNHAGVPYAGLRVTLEPPDGDEREIELDDTGSATVDLPRAGRSRLRFGGKLRRLTADDGDPIEGFSRSPEDVEIAPTRRAAISLASGRTHRLVTRAPVQSPTQSFPGALFGFDSAFPTAGIVHLVKFAQELTDRRKRVSIGLFGHADARGDEAYNKDLSDRRAEIAFALLTADFDRFKTVADTEDWDDAHYQAMLRTVGCNPGAIDGEPGEMTAAAVRAFREDYNAGFFHSEGRRERAFGDLPDGEDLDTSTKDAILDAYHAEMCGAIAPNRFLGPGFSGCGEFNPLGDEAAHDRRVTLTIWGSDAPRGSDFPCTKGDAAACDIDDRGLRRCRFYREHIDEQAVRDDLDPFYDFRWLKTSTGKAHLSALTQLPDTNEIEFAVALSGKPPRLGESEPKGTPPNGPRELARLPGLIRNGVAYALWAPPEHYDPFEVEQWFEGRFDQTHLDELTSYAAPVFVIHHPEGWGLSPPPGTGLHHTFLSDPPADELATVLRADGTILLVRSASDLDGLRHEGGDTVALLATPKVQLGSGGKS